jgi:hypothetical protein
MSRTGASVADAVAFIGLETELVVKWGDGLRFLGEEIRAFPYVV